jgi:hypothetical protein
MHGILLPNEHFKQIKGEGGSVVVKALCYKPERSGFETQGGE